MAAWDSSVFGPATEYLAYFGAAVAAWWTLKFLASLWRGCKSYLLGIGTNPQKLGQWAVVTGSTDGIGKAYALQLAQKGMDIVLISRNPDKLSDVANEIESQCQVKTKCVAVDFTGGPEIYAKIKSELSGLEIGVLVNNVGVAYDTPDYFEALDETTIRNMINVNCNSVAEMTRIVLPEMAARRKGAIINVSSASSLNPTSFLTLYSATKTFVDFFSRGVQSEYKDKGLIIQSVVPFFVSTKLSKIRRGNMFVPTPSRYVRSALGTLGVTSKTFGCISHEIQGYIIECIPKCIAGPIARSQMLAVRAKAYKKKAKAN